MFIAHRALPPAVATRWLCAVAAATLCLAPVRAAALPGSGKGDYIGLVTVGVGGGYAIPNTDEYGDVPSWRVTLGYSPAPWFEACLEVGHAVIPVTQPDADGIPEHTIASGKLDVWPLTLSLQYRALLPQLLSTAAFFVGGGYYLLDYEMGDDQRAALAAAGSGDPPGQAVDDAWGLHAGAAIERTLTSQVSLYAEGRYLFLAPPTRGAAGEGSRFDGTLDLNTWIFTGGLKVAF